MDQPKRCKCGCGREVSPGASWIRGHASRGEGGYRPFPSPDQVTGEILADIGELVPDDEPTPHAPAAAQPADDSPSPSEAGPAPDEPPAHATREWRKKKIGGRSKNAPPRITAAISKDIEGKIGFLLEFPGQVWAVRDPICGGMFVQQVPAMATSGARWVCMSPQLVEWFTSTGGGFIVALDFAAACWPWFTAVMAHHVYHSIEDEAAPEPDYQRYAA
jgi:hypothetical protein